MTVEFETCNSCSTNVTACGEQRPERPEEAKGQADFLLRTDAEGLLFVAGMETPGGPTKSL